MQNVHSGIMSEAYMKSMEMINSGIDVLRLNTGSPKRSASKCPKASEPAA